MDGHHAKWKAEVQNAACKYDVQNPANTMQLERLIFQMSEILCETRRSICKMQVDFAEYQASSIFCFSVFFGLDGFASFLSSWLCKASRASWLHGFVCVHLFTLTKTTIVGKSQTRPIPKQRPQHQQLLVCSSGYTSNNHNSNSNSNRSNNKKLLLQLQLKLQLQKLQQLHATTIASTAKNITRQTRTHD